MVPKFKKDVEFKFAEKLPAAFYSHQFDYRILTSVKYRNDVKMMYVYFQLMNMHHNLPTRIKLYYKFINHYLKVTKSFLTFEKKENRTNEMFNIWLDIMIENIIGIHKGKVIRDIAFSGKFSLNAIILTEVDIKLRHVSKIYYIVKGFFNILFV